eukprot:CAMPEP_0198116992 /NCGR_PEP_ID=MMETSP1442-20131203/15934_1 /TAXON_ID= /ORGANISM="Craspedostauros australis, Strain CCMP3328" /LENGTH=95 /DNA_ID=CAMNT_0043774939 /DNA_START=128 /DNA_END=412 /DNA_ORIENTATION=-
MPILHVADDLTFRIPLDLDVRASIAVTQTRGRFNHHILGRACCNIRVLSVNQQDLKILDEIQRILILLAACFVLAHSYPQARVGVAIAGLRTEEY